MDTAGAPKTAAQWKLCDCLNDGVWGSLNLEQLKL